jgi:hypothetical protein
MALQQFFYDEQIRRFLLQFTRIFSNFQVEYGRDSSGAPTYTRIPVRYGDASKQASVIMADNSANKMPNSPLMTFYITSLDYARDRMQDPTFVDKKTFRQRSWDDTTQTYEATQGNAFTVERLMPVPYNLTINLDIWTTNTTMKLQILEQVLTLFNPSLEIQSTDNYIDWTSLSVVELSGTNWSSRSIPQGTEANIDISTLTFNLPIWITPPARVTKMGVIHKIIGSVFDANGDARDALLNDDLLLGTRQKITPFGYQVVLVGNQLQLLRHNQVELNEGTLDPAETQPSTVDWPSLIDVYGELRAGITQVRLIIPGSSSEVVGTVALHPSDDSVLLFTVDEDTVPTNTLTAVTAVIDPLASGPGQGLAAAATGQRYLLLEAIGDADNTDSADAWGSLVASANDIIEYDGSNWTISFDASANSTKQYVSNLTTSIQYKWDGTAWTKSYQGLYEGGEWSLVL